MQGCNKRIYLHNRSLKLATTATFRLKIMDARITLLVDRVLFCGKAFVIDPRLEFETFFDLGMIKQWLLYISFIRSREELGTVARADVSWAEDPGHRHSRTILWMPFIILFKFLLGVMHCGS